MLTEGYRQRFGGIGRLFGTAAMETLAGATVVVVGVGGVGSWTVEGLIRSGVGRIVMIDGDDVCVTNTNRQLPALSGTVGRPKTAVLAERMRLINPEAVLEERVEFLGAGNVAQLLPGGIDFVIDAVDHTGVKALMIAHCGALRVPVLTVGGAGGKVDASAVRCADLAQAQGDPLLRMVRRELRRTHGFAGGHDGPMGIPCVYSAEVQRRPMEECGGEGGGSLRMDCASGWGAGVFVTGVFGLAAAGEVVRRLVAV
jgi:tRNA A37 threonylcarbamoyladenosine dehydratase